MFASLGILSVGVLIAIIEVPSLLRKKLKKELWVFSILLLFGVGLSIAQSVQMKIPNPMDWITAIYKPISDIISALLK